MDLNNDFVWNELFNLAQNEEDKDNIERLKNILEIGEARVLFNTIFALSDAKDIKILEKHRCYKSYGRIQLIF